jgi:hypothetical protein
LSAKLAVELAALAIRFGDLQVRTYREDDPETGGGGSMEGAPKTTIGQYLTNLAKDAELLAAYQQDPATAMADAGLPQADRDLILSKDVEAVRQAIEEEFEHATIALIIQPCPKP